MFGTPKILILDDTTSALDFKTESNILSNLINYSHENNLTTLISSQRVLTVSKCDRILVFNNGKLEAIGNAKSLEQTSPLYRQMLQMQKKEVS